MGVPLVFALELSQTSTTIEQVMGFVISPIDIDQCMQCDMENRRELTSAPTRVYDEECGGRDADMALDCYGKHNITHRRLLPN